MNKKTLRWMLLSCLTAVAVVSLVMWQQFMGGAVRAERELLVGSEADYQMLVDSLMPELKHRKAFECYARRIDLAQTFKPGRYVIESGMSVVQVARMLKLGLQTPVRVTVRGVRTPEQLASKLARQLDADSAAWVKAFRSRELAEKFGFTTQTLFSMFLPNTYEFYWTVSPEQFVERMHKEHERFWVGTRDAKRERSGLSRLEVMTLASIVAEETAKRDEMPRIAGVYVNRLRRGIPLQADPTVKYAMQDFGLRRILFRHLKVQSPYNTYVNKGLPPSPICMPDVAAIDAVLDFEHHTYIYFCARPELDGYHRFARTLAEHNANARAYSRALDQRGIK